MFTKRWTGLPDVGEWKTCLKAPNIDEVDNGQIYYNNSDTTIKLNVGDTVTFTIGYNNQGPCARNVWRKKKAIKKPQRPKSVTKTVTTTKHY